MSVTPTIRRLTLDDYDAVITLWQQAGLDSIRPQGRDSREAIAALASQCPKNSCLPQVS